MVLAEILELAHDIFRHDSRSHRDEAPSLLHVLCAYDGVMSARGLGAEARIYAALLRLSADAETDWFAKFKRECLRLLPADASVCLCTVFSFAQSYHPI